MGMQILERQVAKGFLGALMVGFVLIGSPSIASASCPADMVGTGADADNACQVISWTHLAAIDTDDASRALVYSLTRDLLTTDSDYEQIAGPEANADKGWKPIGTPSNPFTGDFDGGGKSIAGIQVNDATLRHVGLFGAVSGAEIKNLAITDFAIEASRDVAALAGYADGLTKISNIRVKAGTLEATSYYLSGLLAVSSGTQGSPIEITDSSVEDVTVTYSTAAFFNPFATGGLVGQAVNTRLERVYFDGTIDSVNQPAAGLVGDLQNSTITDAYALGELIGSIQGQCLNGLVYKATQGSLVSNVYSAMKISQNPANNVCAGGLVYLASVTDSASFLAELSETGFYDVVQGTVIPGSSVRGQAQSTEALLTTSTFTDAGWDFSTVWQQTEGESYPYFKSGAVQDPAPAPKVIPCPTGLLQADDGACLVSSLDDLQKLNDAPTQQYRLTQDLSASEVSNWTPLLKFGGVLDGAGFAIDGLTIDVADTGAGLFKETVRSALIKDLALTNVDIKTNDFSGVGALAGYHAGTIRDVYVQGSIVKGTGTFANSAIGGLVGQMQFLGTIESSFAQVSFDTGPAKYVGGLVGLHNGIVDIAGPIKDSYAYVSIKGTGEDQGGLVGRRNGSNSPLSANLIINSYSKSSFEGTQSKRGGINSGTHAGGVVSTYWDQQVTGVTVSPTVGGGSPRSTLEMKSRSTFAGWDFGSSSSTGVWSIVEEDVEVDGQPKKKVSYPYLSRLAAHGFIDASDVTFIGVETVTPPLELATTQAFTPAAGATDVEPFTSISVKFAEALSSTIGANITLKNSGGNNITISRTVSGDTLRIVPNTSLLYDETYTVNIPAGVLSASADSAKKNLTIAWSFSTQSSTVEGGDGCPGRMINASDDPTALQCEVTNWAQLAAINSSIPLSDSDPRTPLGLSYILKNDLGPTTSGYEAFVSSPTLGWAPIGNNVTPFHGILDGNGKSIQGLIIKRKNTARVGLFGRVALGHIKNLVLEDVLVEGGELTGALAGQIDQAQVSPLPSGAVGQSNTMISRVFVSGRVSPFGDNSGGLVGQVVAAPAPIISISEVGFVGQLVAINAGRVGGLIGHTRLGGDGSSGAGLIDLSDAYLIGSITTPTNSGGVGGLVGEVESGSQINVGSSYAATTMVITGGSHTRAGALFGFSLGAISLDTDVYWLKTDDWTVGSSDTQVPTAIGGDASFVGLTGSGNAVEITEPSAILGDAATITLQSLDFSSVPADWIPVTPMTQGSFVDLFPILVGVPAAPQIKAQLGPRQCSDDIANGFGLEASPCEISNWNELKAINEFPGSFYTLVANLDKTTAGYSTTFAALDGFYGSFDGNDLTISDLVIRQTGTSTNLRTGLFSSLGRTFPTTEKATVKDLTLANVDVQSAAYATGALAGLSVVALIDNVHVSGKVTGTGTSNERIGGLIGEVVRFYSDHTIQNSSSSATVTGRDMVGGLVGYRAGTIINSFATGDVTGQSQVGGLVGRAGDEEPDSITNSYATGNVTALGVAGGLVGDRVGQSSGSLTLERVFASGNVTTSGSRAGGLIGRFTLAGTLTVTDAYATGDVTAENVVAGFIGEVGFNSTVTIDRAFSTGAVTRSGTAGDPITGGFLAADQSTAIITNSYWDVERSGQSSSVGLTNSAGLTTAQITGTAAATNMAGLGFGSTDAWVTVVEGTTAGALSDGSPILSALPVPPQLNAHGVGLGNLGISLTEPALSLFNDIISASNLNIALTAANAEALQAAATAAETIIGVASGTLPRGSLTVAMLTGIGITGVTADNIDGANVAVAAVSDPSTLVTVAAVQAVITAGVEAYESAAAVINEFVGGGSGTPTPPTPQNYEDVGVKDVTNDNIGAINDLVKNSDIDGVDTEAFQHLVDAYNEIIEALGDTPKRHPELTEEDYAALGFGEIVLSDDIADLFNSLLGQLDVATVEGWGIADPATTYANLKARADLAAKVIGFADEDAETAAELIQPDLEDLFVYSLLGDAAQVSLFNQVVGASKPSDVSSVEKLQAIATAMGPILGGTATLENYNAAGLGLTNGMLPLFEEVLADRNESPVTYATLKEVAAAVSSLIDVAAGVGSKTPLTLATLESLGIILTDDITKAFPEIYLAVADADPTTLTSVAAVTELINAAVTAANTFALTVVNGSLSGAYVSGSTVTLVANTAPDGQFFAGWTGATVADASAPVTTLTMPAQNTTVTATFEPIPEPDFTLTVNAGTGGGSYKAGRQITISANLPATGKIFDKWIGADGLIDNPSKSVATLMMPSANQTVTATYIDDLDQLFGLNVGVGIGSGEYKAGERIAIAADLPSDDQLFDRWSGDIEHLDNPANPNTRVTMPRSSVTVVALYVDKPDPLYALTVNGGQGGGEFTAGSTVTISAGLPADGQMFDRWLGDVAHVANVNEANTQVIMPAAAVTLRASYVPVPISKYALTVEGGTGAGDYEAGDVITIAAALPPAGQVFDQWIGQTARVANVSQPNTTITMPASTVTIRAAYKDKPLVRFGLTVGAGTGSGDYEQGQVVAIQANLPSAGEVFDRWVGQTDAVANINVPNTTLVMPGTDISLTATFKPDPESTPTLARGRGRGRSLEGSKPGPFTGRAIVDDLVTEEVPSGTFVALTAPEAPEVIVNNALVDLYFDKWVGQTAYLNNVHATTAFMYMPNHDVTVLAQFRSIDGTITVTAAGTVLNLGSSVVTSDTELTPGSVVSVKAQAPATGFMFDKWVGQTAYLENVNVPETKLTVPGTNIEIQATYRRTPSADTPVSVDGSTAVNRSPGTYITISAGEPGAGESFDLWGGQNAFVENVFDRATRMYVSVSSVSIAPVYKSAFGPGVDAEAVTALLAFDGTQATPPSAATYTAAGITGVVSANVAVYNAALVALEPTQLSDIQAMVTAYNAVLIAANGNSASPASLTIANYAALGVTIASAEQLAVVNNAVGSQVASAVDSVTELDAIANAADRFLLVAAGQSVSEPLTPADFARLGFEGITAANIGDAVTALVQAVGEGTEPTDIATLQALFDNLAPPPLPVPTLSFWALLLMAGLMWLFMARRRSLFAE